jgi:hypothetical protein
MGVEDEEDAPTAKLEWKTDVTMLQLIARRGSPGHGCPRPQRGRCLGGQSGLASLVPEVEDEADNWGPPRRERSCGTHLLERKREEVGRTFHTTELIGRYRVILV